MIQAGRGSPEENSDERWKHWATKQNRNENARLRRFKFIAGFIGVGLVVWLFWTR